MGIVSFLQRVFKCDIEAEILQYSLANERMEDMRQRHVDDLKSHVEDLKLTVQQLYMFLIVLTAAVTAIVTSTMMVTCYLLRVKDEQNGRLESQNSRYEGIIHEKDERIRQLEQQAAAKQENPDKNSAMCAHPSTMHPPQVPIVYAFNGLPTAAKG